MAPEGELGLDGQRKAGKLYAEIDRTGFYRGTAKKEDRSLMNITFRLPSEELEKKFDKEATAAGLDPVLVLAVIGVESGWEPQAVSERGARGLMQLRRAALESEERLAGLTPGATSKASLALRSAAASTASEPSRTGSPESRRTTEAPSLAESMTSLARPL